MSKWDINSGMSRLEWATQHSEEQNKARSSLGLGDVVAGAIKAVTGKTGCGGCGKRQATLNQAFPAKRVPLVLSPIADARRNLIMHLYPVASNEMWRFNVQQILQRLPLFNGRRIVSVAIDDSTVPIEQVEREFECRVEIRQVKNDPKLGELASFYSLLDTVMSDDPNDCTFYCHGKGVSDGRLSRTKTNRSTIRNWTEWMYRLSLDDWQHVEQILQSLGTVGPFRKLRQLAKSHWYFSGAFYWFRNAYAHQRNWRYVTKEYYGSEAWPGNLFSLQESASLGADNVGSLYDAKQWEAIEKQLMKPAVRVKSEPVTWTLITPTGDRPEAFALCEKYISRQAALRDQRYQWIVVDDGRVPTRTTMNQHVIRRKPSDPGTHTLTVNLRSTLPHIRGERILIIEDDEWYSPNYVERMGELLHDHELVGIGPAAYYFIRESRYREFPEHQHASLCRTGFRSVMLSALSKACNTSHPSVDMRLWADNRSRGHIASLDRLSLGIKGMPGRVGGGGSPDAGIADPNREWLRSFIGDDADAYDPYRFRQPVPLPYEQSLTVYTVNTNGYDVPTVPLNVSPETLEQVRFVAISDTLYPSPWITLPTNGMSDRYLKIMAPQVRFDDSDWTLYFDAQLQLRIDPLSLFAEAMAFVPDDQQEPNMFLFRHQDRDCVYDEAAEIMRIGRDRSKLTPRCAERIKQTGFPQHAGLYLGGILLRHRDAGSFNDIWWSLVKGGCPRDQVCLPVALQDSEVSFASLPTLWWERHYFTRHDHASLQRMKKSARSRQSVK